MKTKNKIVCYLAITGLLSLNVSCEPDYEEYIPPTIDQLKLIDPSNNPEGLIPIVLDRANLESTVGNASIGNATVTVFFKKQPNDSIVNIVLKRNNGILILNTNSNKSKNSFTLSQSFSGIQKDTRYFLPNEKVSVSVISSNGTVSNTITGIVNFNKNK